MRSVKSAHEARSLSGTVSLPLKPPFFIERLLCNLILELFSMCTFSCMLLASPKHTCSNQKRSKYYNTLVMELYSFSFSIEFSCQTNYYQCKNVTVLYEKTISARVTK